MEVDELIRRLRQKYRTGTHRREPFRVLIGTILSQRTNDDVTYPAAERLFSRYRSAEELAAAEPREVARLIKPVGFYNVKAERIVEVAQIIVNQYQGHVPDTLDELLKLPSVGRKTANCVLVFGFGKPAIPVDTHVHRISNRLGLVQTATPLETEMALKEVLDRKYWIEFNELLVHHGRALCRPLRPKCGECFLNDLCPKVNVTS